MRRPQRLIQLLALALVIMLVAVACAPATQPASEPAAQPAAATAPTAAPAAPNEAPPAAAPTEAPPAAPPAAAPTEAATAEPPAINPVEIVPSGTRTFVIVPQESEAAYIVDEEFLAGAASRLGIQAGKVKTTGATSQVNGSLALDFGDSVPQLVSGDFTVDISTLSSDQNRRDNRIRQEWLQSARYPIATFTATSIQNAPASYNEGEEASFQLAGDLTIRETTVPVTFDVKATLQGDTIAGEATTQVKMTDFGFQPPAMGGLLTVGDDTVIQLKFTAKEQ